MERKIIAYVEKHSMLKEKDKVVVGVSGGADSVCLFFVMLKLRKLYDLSLHVLHVNHQMRGSDADEDQRFVEALGKQYTVPVKIVKKDVRLYAREHKLSEEEAGRFIRYEAFQTFCEEENATKTAIAHNMNDNAETMLFHLARGSGTRGLCGILPVRGNIIRPLLCVTRDEIEEYLKCIGQTYRTDASNYEDDYSRNQIRHYILPLMGKLNTKSIEHMSETANLLKETQDYMDKNAESACKRIVKYENGQYLLNIDMLITEDLIIQKEVIRKTIIAITQNAKDIDNQHIERIRLLCEMPSGKQVDLPNGIKAMREYQHLKLGIPSIEMNEYEVLLEIPGRYSIPGTDDCLDICVEECFDKVDEIPKNDYTKWFDYDKICQAISLRNRRNGDYFQVNQEGGTKKVKDYFIDKKLPRDKRSSIPLLADGGHIIWIIGDRISERYKITNKTKNILKAKIIGGKKNEH
ncbi:MAG: tRNA lysidine(34) synthetase TilS [Velocimicrobium sp.]